MESYNRSLKRGVNYLSVGKELAEGLNFLSPVPAWPCSRSSLP